MKALIMGTSGQLGAALARTLRAAGATVVGIDVMESPYTDVVASITEPERVRRDYADRNVKPNEYLFRRVDIEDAAEAHLRAVEKAQALARGADSRSELEIAVGPKLYHATKFADGPYPVE